METGFYTPSPFLSDLQRLLPFIIFQHFHVLFYTNDRRKKIRNWLLSSYRKSFVDELYKIWYVQFSLLFVTCQHPCLTNLIKSHFLVLMLISRNHWITELYIMTEDLPLGICLQNFPLGYYQVSPYGHLGRLTKYSMRNIQN